MIRAEIRARAAPKKGATLLIDRMYWSAAEVTEIIRSYQIVVRLLLVLEFIQVLYFVISVNLQKTWNLNLFEYASFLTSILQLGTVIEGGKPHIQIGLLYAFFGINVFAVTLSILLPTVFTNSKRTNSSVMAFFSKIIAFYVMFFHTILVIPFMQMSYISLMCSSEIDSMFQCTISLILSMLR